MEIKRGDIYYADLRPVVGSEQGGVRPVLIIQNDTGNHYSPTVIVAAITSSRKKEGMPTHVKLHGQQGLRKVSCILLEQLRTIDRERLDRYIGTLNEQIMTEVDKAIGISIGLNRGFEASYWLCPVSERKNVQN